MKQVKSLKLKVKSSSFGFTLIEIMVAVMVISFMSGGGVAAYRRLNDRALVEGAAKQVEQALRETQKRASSGVKPTGCSGALASYSISMGGALGEDRYSIQADCATTDPAAETFDLPTGTRFPLEKRVSFPALGKGATPETIWVQNDSQQITYELRVSQGGSLSGLGQAEGAVPTPTPTPIPEAANLVPNPGFEIGSPASWGTSSSGCSITPTYQWTSPTKHSGTYAVGIKYTGAVGCTAQYQTSSTAAPVIAGSSYYFSGWIKASGVVNKAFLRVSFYNSSGLLITSVNSASQVGTTSWTQVTQTMSAPSGAVSARIHVRLLDAGTAYFDDLMFAKL